MALLLLEIITINLSVSSLLNIIALSKNTYSLATSYNIKTKKSCIEYINKIDLPNKLKMISSLISKVNHPIFENIIISLNNCSDEIKTILAEIYNNNLVNFHKLETLNSILNDRISMFISLSHFNNNTINNTNSDDMVIV
jgi:hypothetical protein